MMMVNLNSQGFLKHLTNNLNHSKRTFSIK
jgi:hypothetical protein